MRSQRSRSVAGRFRLGSLVAVVSFGVAAHKVEAGDATGGSGSVLPTRVVSALTRTSVAPTLKASLGAGPLAPGGVQAPDSAQGYIVGMTCGTGPCTTEFVNWCEALGGSALYDHEGQNFGEVFCVFREED